VAKRKGKAHVKLTDYRAKRSAQATPEPFGAGVSRPRLFCVQKHAARQLHYDFRLEWGGTLWSWAVPKGPSPDPDEKRYAVHVEDHPVEYADFEGIIPKGNYGAGSVIVWDKGLWVPLEEPEPAMENGVLHFQLRGYKLRGTWLLIRMNKKGKDSRDWLLRKKPDAYASAEENPYPETSVLSGLTVEDLGGGKRKAAAVVKRLAKLGAPERPVDPFGLKLMLAKTADAPFSSPDWLFELKYDGYRVLAARDASGEARIRSRNGHDITAVFPDVALAVRSLPYPNLILDGELVVLDEGGRPDFGRLQRRAKLSRRRDIERATVELPATLFVFDLPGFGGRDLRGLPLRERKRFLSEILPPVGPLRYAEHFAEQGEALFDSVTRMGLEGIMAKKADSPYRGIRSAQWLKIPADRTGDFVVCGYTSGKGSRAGLGALHVGAFAGGELRYTGRVGTGFRDEELGALRETLEGLRRKDPPCAGETPRGPGHFWVEPEVVIEARYKTVTDGGVLRHPVFLRLRDDKEPSDCVLEEAEATDTGGSGGESFAETIEEGGAPEPVEKIVHFSNLDKMFWPDEGYTKGRLIDYYTAVWPWIEPYLKDRPLVLTRYPDGIEGKSFYQKNVPDFLPPWIRTESMWSESAEREVRYLVCDDLESLLWIVNSAAIPLHLWSSRANNLQHPDWCILDLDPKGAPFGDVMTLARSIHELCGEIDLSCYVKTSGSTGLHVLLPLGGRVTYEQSRMLGQLIARVIEARHPDISTTARSIPARKGRVYLDYLQNRHGQLLVAPYCVRPLPGAPVSAPLTWREVGGRLGPQKYTIANLGRRLARTKRDPMLPVLREKPDLVAVLSRLAKLIGAR
jgi:bifunctional non-homologous end joining protein LigD